ncbi:hypothetical protein L873DRAFT_1660239 [Choiromyces venosus 120613-1]|uniref:Uncharacterized protein n=1 Tax=Choiromyces venosus 120613-1 TaxID=1336337 RepID=A0A3N4K726_9PEZI|nr:hypothetical protein L873DRAFT_1660239 [Choiromyces venosus 120613-1]
MVEAPLEMQKSMKIPEDHIKQCKDAGLPTEGNAAGNTDFLDLRGENRSPRRLPSGFTTRGIIALVFSSISGILGLVVIAWYGMAEIKS